MKVGADLEDDIRRCRLIRQMIGPENTLVRSIVTIKVLGFGEKVKYMIFFFIISIFHFVTRQMIDANQRWDVAEAISWVSRLAEFKPIWIEEPTCPDDILGHAAIAKVLQQLLYSCWECVGNTWLIILYLFLLFFFRTFQ